MLRLKVILTSALHTAYLLKRYLFLMKYMIFIHILLKLYANLMCYKYSALSLRQINVRYSCKRPNFLLYKIYRFAFIMIQDENIPVLKTTRRVKNLKAPFKLEK